MDGDRANKHLRCVFGDLFFDFIFAADYENPAKFKKQSNHASFGKKQEADRAACKLADGNQPFFSHDNGFMDYFVLYALVEWKNNPYPADFFEEHAAYIHW